MPPHSLQDQVQTLLSSFQASYYLAINYISSTLFYHSSFIISLYFLPHKHTHMHNVHSLNFPKLL